MKLQNEYCMRDELVIFILVVSPHDLFRGHGCLAVPSQSAARSGQVSGNLKLALQDPKVSVRVFAREDGILEVRVTD